MNFNKFIVKCEWKKKKFNEGNQIHNFMSSSGSGIVINYGSGSDFLTSYGSGSTSQKVTVPTVPVPVPVPVPQHWRSGFGIRDPGSEIQDPEKTYSGSRIQGSKRHRIPDPDPQHCYCRIPCLQKALREKRNNLPRLGIVRLQEFWVGNLYNMHILDLVISDKKANTIPYLPCTFQGKTFRNVIMYPESGAFWPLDPDPGQFFRSPDLRSWITNPYF